MTSSAVNRPICKFCGLSIAEGPGFMMVETIDLSQSFMCHEECYQLSGEDDGYVKRMYDTLGDAGGLYEE